MLIRTYADIDKLEGNNKLSAAEETLIANCKIGELTVLGDGTRPAGPSVDRTIRADVLRYLILGGCDVCKVHELGVSLVGAWIKGALDLRFAEANGAVNLSQCGFGAPIAARQARIDLLQLDGSSLPALDAVGALIEGDVFLNELKSSGAVSFGGAEIGGQLSCVGAYLNGGAGYALDAQDARIKGGVFLGGLRSTGAISLAGAEIGGPLACEGAEVHCGGDGKALNAQGATIKGNIFLDELKSTGPVSFSSAELGGQLSCVGAEFHCGGDGKALNAQGATIKDSVFLEGVKGTGAVSLVGAKIGGQLSCKGAELNGGKGEALNAQGATIKDGVFLRQITSTGMVSFVGAEIFGPLSCVGGKLNGGEGIALDGRRLVAKGGFHWYGVTSVVGALDLRSAHLGDLLDDEQSWDLVSELRLVAVTYENLAGPLDLALRKRWLKKGAKFNGQFHPQPYQELAKFYRETGHRHEAREILIAKEREQRKAVRASIRRGRGGQESVLEPNIQIFIYKLWDEMMRVVAGYGYKPWLSLWWLGGLVAAMTLWSHFVWQAGDFAPNSAVVLTSADWRVFSDGTPERAPSDDPAIGWSSGPGRDYETFYSFAYAMDVVVPVLELGQMEAWAPSPARGAWGYWLFYGQKIFVVLGWVVTALAAAAVTGMIRRDD